MNKKNLLKTLLPISTAALVGGGYFTSVFITSCSVIKPEIVWTGEKSVNINGTGDKNVLTLHGYFLRDFKDPKITYLDENGNQLFDGNEKLRIIMEKMIISCERANQNQFQLNFNISQDQLDLSDYKKVNGCYIRFDFRHSRNKTNYVFEKKVIFQDSNILDLKFSLDNTIKPSDYLKTIPDVRDFANEQINTLQPYNEGYKFDGIADMGRDVYFGYRTDYVYLPPTPTPDQQADYEEMISRYVDISNILKADMCYLCQVLQNNVESWVPLPITTFKMDIDEFRYDMNTSTILSFTCNISASLSSLGSASFNFKIFSPYQLFGAFERDFPDKTYFSQLIPVPVDEINNSEGGLYDCSVLVVVLGEEMFKFDCFYSYPGPEIFGDLQFRAETGVYLPIYWLSNCEQINLLELDEEPFTESSKFQLINSAGLTSNNFLNIGIFEDKGVHDDGYSSENFGTSYFLQDAAHIGYNTFKVRVQNTSLEYDLPWYQVMSFYRGKDGPDNINYVQDQNGSYHIEYFLNNCFVESKDNVVQIVPSNCIEFN